jgi:hypothetical protein
MQSEGKPLMQGNAGCVEKSLSKKDSVCFASDPRCAQKPGDPRNQTVDDGSLWKLQWWWSNGGNSNSKSKDDNGF